MLPLLLFLQAQVVQPPITFMQTQPAITFIVMDDYVRDYLAAEWDLHAHDNPKLERGYCLGWQLDNVGGQLVYRITQVSPATNQVATPESIDFTCKDRYAQLSELHVHPWQTCARTKAGDVYCFSGGSFAAQCKESPDDRRYLSHTSQPFHMVQCGRDGIIWYFREAPP
jgi:hypothetical protein